MNLSVEKSAQRYVAYVVERYGVLSALSRTRIMRHEYPAKRVPRWLLRSIEMLEQRAAAHVDQQEGTPSRECP
jgi:hypothetical protein